MEETTGNGVNVSMNEDKPTNGVQGGLTAKQERFVQEYLIDFNAAAAAERAGYSKKTARFIGAENLTKPNIQAAVQDQIKARAERTEITADLVVQETWATFKEARAKGKYSAAASLLALLGRHTDAFPNKHEHSGPDGEPIPIRFMEFASAERPFDRAAERA
jgi:hypothetical protein